MAAIGLASSLLPGSVRASERELSLEAAGLWRGYAFESDWTSRQEHLFQESVRAGYRSFIVDQAFASYNVGLTLGMADRFESSRRDRFYQLDYDAGVDIWKDGIVPVTLYAQRSTLDASQDAVPYERALRQTLGYTAAFVPKEGPRVRTRGYVSDFGIDASDGTHFERRWDVAGDVSHYGERLSGRATLEHQAVLGDITGQDRVVDSARVDADYHVVEDVDVQVHGLSSGYQFGDGDDAFRMATENANTFVRWTPTKKLLGTVSAQASRNDYDGSSTSSTRLETAFGVSSPEPWGLVGTAGVERSSYGTDGDVHTFTGEFLDARALHHYEGVHGELLVDTTGGIAYFEETGVGGGMQEGCEGRVLASRSLAGNLFRLSGGGRLGRQWDSSPRGMDYARLGWEASAEARPAPGLSLLAYADRLTVVQYTLDEGDSDRFELYGVLRYAPIRHLQLEYGVTQTRQELDASWGSALGQSVRGTAYLTDALSLSLDGHRFVYDDDRGSPWWWTRGATELRYRTGLTMVSVRLAAEAMDGDTAETTSLYGFVELRRGWRWDL